MSICYKELNQRLNIANAVIKNNLQDLENYGQNTAALGNFRFPFLRISYDEAITLLQRNGYPNLQWGDDLKAEHEQSVIVAANELERHRPHGLITLGDRPVLSPVILKI